jgi:hypothetical protein
LKVGSFKLYIFEVHPLPQPPATQCPNESLHNQREITLILKRDKRKSISAVVNKKHFKELTKYRVEDFVLTIKKLHGLVEMYDPLIKIF